MNYPESLQILEEIKKANKILLNCHRSPDPDSVASALSLYLILKQLNKENVSIICPDEIPFNCKFLPNTEIIKKVDFGEFNFEEYDLFLIADSGNWDQVTGGENIQKSKIKTIVLDHHFTNSKYGNLNILDENAGSAAAVIFKFANDINVAISSDMATTLLTGIIADTLSFQTDVIGDSSLTIADSLIKFGADRNNIIFNLYKSKSLDEIHLMGEMLKDTQIDEMGKFAWVAISKDIIRKYPMSKDAKSYVVGSFLQSLDGTDFGFALEESDSYLSVSFRSRTNFDVSKIAEELGGGGHKSASAARLNLPFDQAVIKVLEVCRKYANKN